MRYEKMRNDDTLSAAPEKHFKVQSLGPKKIIPFAFIHLKCSRPGRWREYSRVDCGFPLPVFFFTPSDKGAKKHTHILTIPLRFG